MSTIEKLLGLQERDIRIREIRQQLKDIPARKKLEEARLDELKKSVADADAALKLKQTETKHLELEIESRKTKMATLRTQQMNLKTNQEFKLMEKEINTITEDITRIEDSQLVLMKTIEEARKVVGTFTEALKAEQARVNADLGQWDKQTAHLETELKGLQVERAGAATEVNHPAFLSRYEAVISRKNPAIVPLENGICGGCHMQLPPYVPHDVRKAVAPVSCNFCGRLLYFLG